jgi:hypothetical protein
MTAIHFCSSLLDSKWLSWPIQGVVNSLIRSGYHQSAYEMDRLGYHKEAARLRNDAKLVGT